MNGKLKILIIYDGDKYDKNDILDDLEFEGFSHYFKVDSEIDEVDFEVYLEDADEIWTFGEVEDKQLYILASQLGKDIWIMT